MIKNIKTNFKSILQLTLVMYYPFFVIVVLGKFLIQEKDLYFRELGATFILTAILTGVILLINSIKLKKYILIFFQFALSFLIAFKFFFYYNFDTKPSASAIFIIFETNATEASEFFANYVNFNVIIIYISCFLVLIFLIFKFFTKPNFFSFLKLNKLSLSFKLLVLALVFFSCYMLKRTYSEFSLILILSHSISEYNIAKDYYKANLAKPNNESIVLNNINKQETEQIGVVIIGESTSRWHMQLYDYNRETNPMLSSMKEELYIFNDVISPAVMTIRSLEKALTLSNINQPKADNNFSVVQLANAAGFDTFWISNQQPVGFTESTPTIIATAAKYKHYLASDSYYYSIYDESLIPEIKKAINTKAKRKLIFVHLIGTHRSYKKRYPKEFNYFDGINERTKFKTEYSKSKVNEYDNAVRYNDFVISEIIKLVKAKQNNSFVVYFSDHGEEVFDTQDFIGHHTQKGSKPMYDIPFISWFSEDYLELNKRIDTLKNYNKRKYNSEDFIYSFSDIIDAEFKGYDASRSIFNNKFIERPRWIRDTLNYDVWE